MQLEGRCYCGQVRYKAEGEPLFRGQCHCRECQYITGGHPVVVLGMPDASFEYTAGEPGAFTRPDLESPVTREFCTNCGTHILTRAPAVPNAVLIKVGTLDDPSVFEKPDMAIFVKDAQPFHHVPDDVPTFDTVPG